MAQLKVLSSSSEGNCYILECNDEKLIIELGCSWKDIMSNLNYDLSKVRGTLVSHKHLDHSKSIPNALRYGLSVYSCEDVQSIHSKVKVLKKGVKTRIGGFIVQPIPVEHSCECYAFLIEHKDIGRLAFVTDCVSFPYKIKNVNHWLIEANNDEMLMIDHLCEGYNSHSMSNQHLEINDTIDVLKRNYSLSLQTILLLHLSAGNSNAEGFKQRVKEAIGVSNVFIADKGLTINLEKDEF